MEWASIHTLRTRSAKRADARAIETLRRSEAAFALPTAAKLDEDTTVVELDHRIVAVATTTRGTIEPDLQRPVFRASDDLFAAGTPNAFVGAGLWIAPELAIADVRKIHVLLHTFGAQQHGMKWAVVRAPLTPRPPFEPEALLQQIVAGAVERPWIEVLLADGYFPWCLDPEGSSAYFVWRNEAI